MKKCLSIIIILGLVVIKSNAQTYKGPKVNEDRLLLGVTNIAAVNLVTYGSNATAKQSMAMGTGGAASLLVSALRDAVTLPVTLVSFDAQKENEYVDITWVTSSEKKLSHFEVLRSVDGFRFEKLGVVQSNVSSDELIMYSFKDKAPEDGINYYKLKMVDLDGTFKESKHASVNFSLNNPGFSIYVNKDLKNMKFDISSVKAETNQIEIFSISGKKLLSANMFLNKGINSFIIDLDVSPQILVAVISNSSGNLAKKFIY
jgi:hypothetical protein